MWKERHRFVPCSHTCAYVKNSQSVHVKVFWHDVHNTQMHFWYLEMWPVCILFRQFISYLAVSMRTPFGATPLQDNMDGDCPEPRDWWQLSDGGLDWKGPWEPGQAFAFSWEFFLPALEKKQKKQKEGKAPYSEDWTCPRDYQLYRHDSCKYKCTAHVGRAALFTHLSVGCQSGNRLPVRQQVAKLTLDVSHFSCCDFPPRNKCITVYRLRHFVF